MSTYFESQSNAKSHEGDIELDPNIISKLPAGSSIQSCRGHGASNWNQTARLIATVDGELISFFLKIIANNPNGADMFRGEFESMHLINQYIPNNSPTPLAFGECRNSHRFFILFTFHVLQSGLPSIPNFVSAVAKLHASSRGNSPNGKFGFHITTYNGTLAQDNTWTNTWEDFFTRGMRRMLQLEEEARGPDEELHQLVQPFLHRVIPRLLRPMETSGRKIQPVLIHGDLWIGNISTLADTGEPFIFDASAFWGHHEYELSTMRPLENEWGRECMATYHKHIVKSDPEEDWDARNALYAIRTYIHDSALYPQIPKFRQKLIHEMRQLVQQFSEGYVVPQMI